MKTPIKFDFRREWWPLFLLAATVALSFVAYPQLPERVASHWNFAGQVDGWSSRSFQVWFFPLLMAGMYALFLLLPVLDPKKDRYAEFSQVYALFKSLLLSVFFVIDAASTVYNLGYDINISVIVGGTIGIMMIVIGNYLGKLKRNWFVGIKTPWTLSSDNVWNKTHRVGGRLFVIWGLILIAAPWLPPTLGITLFIGGAILATAGSFIYSFFLYKQENSKKG